jgi:hypothetical protein
MFFIRSHTFCSRPASDSNCPTFASFVAGVITIHCHTSLICGGMLTFCFLGLPLNCGPCNLHLLSSWDWATIPVLEYLHRWNLPSTTTSQVLKSLQFVNYSWADLMLNFD